MNKRKVGGLVLAIASSPPFLLKGAITDPNNNTYSPSVQKKLNTAEEVSRYIGFFTFPLGLWLYGKSREKQE